MKSAFRQLGRVDASGEPTVRPLFRDLPPDHWRIIQEACFGVLWSIRRTTPPPSSKPAYYASMGSRGQAGNGPANEFETGMSMAERMAYANSQVFVTVMLETGGAFDHLEAIAAMPGIDALTLGPTDLAQDLGVYGTPDEGRVLDERRQMIIEAAKRHGKTTAMLVTSYDQARQWKQAGVMLLGYSSDVGVLQDGYRRALKEINGGG